MIIRFMWKEIVSELVASGLSEREIADSIGVTQPTINRIKLGRRRKIDHETGEALLALQKTVRATHAGQPA